MKLLFFVTIIGLLVFPSNGLQIPETLIHCYRANETIPFVGNSLPLLLDLIRKIENTYPTSIDIRQLAVKLTQKIRLDGVHRAHGVPETPYVTPYGAGGIQTPKFSLIRRLVSDVPGNINFERALNDRELCFLHKLISSTVEPFERGDESRVCPLSLNSTERLHYPWLLVNKLIDPLRGSLNTTTTRISRCPIEMGVVKTDYGDISPGTVIASIAAALEPQRVQHREILSAYSSKHPLEQLEEGFDTNRAGKLLKSSKLVENVLASGLAGDLAEVCVYQGPYNGINPLISTEANWNDTIYPRVRYFTDDHAGRWELTEAEILGGIDGLFISQSIYNWVLRLPRLKLSQVLDMYYSARGIPVMSIENVRFKHKNRRKTIVWSQSKDYHQEKILVARSLRNIDSQDSAAGRLKFTQDLDEKYVNEQTLNLAEVLQYMTSTLIVSDEALQSHCESAVKLLFEKIPKILQNVKSKDPMPRETNYVRIDATLIIDGSRQMYETQRLISYIAESIEVSHYGSFLSVMNGENGNMIVNRTNSLSSIYQDMQNYSGPYPITFSLSRSLTTLVSRLANQTEYEQRKGITTARPLVVILLCQQQRITEADYNRAANILRGSLVRYPDLYFIFITNNGATFDELMRGIIPNNFNTQHMGNNLTNYIRQQYKVISTTGLDTTEFGSELTKYVRKIPQRIIAPYCKNSLALLEGVTYYYEDYVTPQTENIYRISPYYIKYADEIRVQFSGAGYGILTVCMSRDILYIPIICEKVYEFTAVWFNITHPCDERYNECTPIYFSVTMDQSNMHCSENDCRFPDQVRYIVRHEELLCEIDGRNKGSQIFGGEIGLIFCLGVFLIISNLI